MATAALLGLDGAPAVMLAAAASLLAVLLAVSLGRTRRRLRAAEARLAENARRHDVVAEAASDAIVSIDEESRIVLANPAAERIFGHALADLVGRSLTDLMPPAMRPMHLAAFRRYLATGRRTMSWTAVPLTALHRDGREIPVEVSFGESHVDGRRLFTGILRDTSERKRLEEELFQAQKMEAIGRLAGGIAHDFNNMLTSLMGHAASLSERIPPGDERSEDVREIMSSAERAARLTRQLLAFSRRQVLQPRVVDLNVIVDDLRAMLARLLPEGISFTTVLAPERCTVMADPGQLERVLLNLVLNARDAMPDGGSLTIETSVLRLGEESAEHPGVPAGEHVTVTVSDTGRGMDESVRAHLFEPFFTTKPQALGTGLGLSTVHGIVAQSQGQVVVTSDPGKGSRFRVYLPRTHAPASVEDEARPPSGAPAPTGGTTILLAEDDDAVRRIARATLAHRGYVVLDEASGEAALRRAESHDGPIDVLVTDVGMPGMSGVELARRLRATSPTTRVVYMSGYASDAGINDEVAGRRATFLPKPFSPTALADAVRRILDAAAEG